MRPFKLKFFIFYVSVFFLSCLNAPFDDGDLFFLRNEKADMPILVKGNFKSGIFLLYLHGGPGSSSFLKAGTPAFDKLEEKYAVIYWDQRLSGNSQGNATIKSFNRKTLVEDLHKVILLTKNKYTPKKIFLIGKSFGGFLGFAYLLDEISKGMVDGFVEIDGAHDPKDTKTAMQNWIILFGEKEIKAGKDVEYWKEAVNYLKSSPEQDMDWFIKTQDYLDKAHGKYNEKYDPSAEGVDIFSSPNSLFSLSLNPIHLMLKLGTESWLSSTNLSSEFAKITLPVLFIWGKLDGAVPLEIGQKAFNAIGTTIEKKTFILCENSAHHPELEEPEKTASSIITFIEKTK